MTLIEQRRIAKLIQENNIFYLHFTRQFVIFQENEMKVYELGAGLFEFNKILDTRVSEAELLPIMQLTKNCYSTFGNFQNQLNPRVIATRFQVSGGKPELSQAIRCLLESLCGNEEQAMNLLLFCKSLFLGRKSKINLSGLYPRQKQHFIELLKRCLIIEQTVCISKEALSACRLYVGEEINGVLSIKNGLYKYALPNLICCLNVDRDKIGCISKPLKETLKKYKLLEIDVSDFQKCEINNFMQYCIELEG